MRRTALERHRTFSEWRQRHSLDGALEPGHFRKGRRAWGCLRYCPHCAAGKLRSSLQGRRSELAFKEQLDLE